MSRLRKLFALLLLLALPLKGMAGMLMGACPAMAPALWVAPLQQALTAMPCHEAADEGSAGVASTSGCPHCASCLAPMIGMPSLPAAPSLPLSQAQPAPPAAAVAEHALAVPQPPPRR